ncbi:MAG: LPS export ABC transporter periplasmic protein LptC [Pyrinomonadaceae bacterium]
MQEVKRKRVTIVGLRARLPLIGRVIALTALFGGLLFVGVSYYRNRNYKPFVMIPQAPELSKQVKMVVNGYEMRKTEGDRVRLWLKAARDVTYSDDHHELEDVQLKVYPATGDKPDEVSAERAMYDAEKGLVSFKGDVNIDTRNNLTAKTDVVVYNQKTEIAETSAPLTFARENVSGHSTGATLDAKNKRLELRSNVEITVVPNAKPTASAKANARSRPVTIHAAHALFDQATLKLNFTGNVTAEQEPDVMSGDTLSATLNEQKHLQKIETRGNSYLRSMTVGRAAEVRSVDMDFFLDADQRLQRASAARDVHARSLDADAETQLNGANNLEVIFAAQNEQNLLKEMRTAGGRSVLTLAAPKSRADDPRAASKRLTADTVNLYWRATGRDLERAEAVGNAELFVDPVQKNAAADRKTIIAPRFDGEFYDAGNLARSFTGSGGAKVTIEPVQPSENRATRTLTAQKVAALFTRETQDVERVDAEGDASFNEADRNGRAAAMSYTAVDQLFRLRGGEPVVWDARARLKATEIDSDAAHKISYGRGKTTTTYYSQEQTNGAMPFAKTKSPVFVVGDRAELQHTTGVAIFTGNARTWQDDNFVRAERLTMYRDTKRLDAETRVQSALYQSKSKNTNGASESVPVFATADRMSYQDTDRMLHYEGRVDVKQGTDRVVSEVADVFLMKDRNELERSVAQRGVVLTQPGRRGTGEWAQYTAADETFVLKGNPAHVEDAEQGNSEAGRLTVYLRENRVVSDDERGGQTSAGRVHSTHRIRQQKQP